MALLGPVVTVVPVAEVQDHRVGSNHHLPFRAAVVARARPVLSILAVAVVGQGRLDTEANPHRPPLLLNPEVPEVQALLLYSILAAWYKAPLALQHP